MSEVTVISALVDQMGGLLAGHPPQVQGAVLADLLAIWLAGHIVPDDPGATDVIREHLLTLHLDTVRKLIPVNEHVHGRSPDA